MALKPSRHVSPFPSTEIAEICLIYRVERAYTDSQSKSTIVNITSAEETREHDDWFGDEIETKRYG